MTAELLQRVEGLGRLVLQADTSRWIRELDVLTPATRGAIRASIDIEKRRPFADLIDLVDEFGGAAVLEAVGQVAARLRRELTVTVGPDGQHHHTSVNGSRVSPPERKR